MTRVFGGRSLEQPSRSWILIHATKLVVGGQVIFEVPFDSWKEEAAWQYSQIWLPSSDLKKWRLHQLSPLVDDSWGPAENSSGKFYTLTQGLVSFPIARLFYAARKMKDQEAMETRDEGLIADAFRKYFVEKPFLLTPFAQVYPDLKKILKLDDGELALLKSLHRPDSLNCSIVAPSSSFIMAARCSRSEKVKAFQSSYQGT